MLAFSQYGPLWLRLSALAVIALTSQIDAQSASNGVIAGRVTRARDGAYIEGATVAIDAMNLHATTTREGAYRLAPVPPGRHTITVRYLGFTVQRIALDVKEEGTSTCDVALEPAAARLAEVLTSALVSGQAAALNLQRDAANLQTVVSREALGQVQEGNIGDALIRLPGIVVETRAGVNRTATIRGLAPQYNSVTVDGLPITNVDGNRDVALDEFPYATLARIEVTKTLTPDMPGDAIGGTLNLVTRTAFDREGSTFTGNAGGTANGRGGSLNRQLELVSGNRFGASGNFGYLVTGSYFEDFRGYDVSDVGYATVGTNPYVIANNNIYDRGEHKRRSGFGANADYRPTQRTRVYFKGIYSDDYRYLDQKGTNYKPTVSQVDNVTFYREPHNVFQMYIAGGQHDLGEWTLDARGSYSRAVKTYPATLQITTGFNNVALTTNASNPNFPAFAITNGVDLNNTSLLRLRTLDITQAPRSEYETTGELSVGRGWTFGGLPFALKGGARRSSKSGEQSQSQYARYTANTTNSASLPPSLIRTYTNDNFLPQSNGNAKLLPFFPDFDKWSAALANSQGVFTATEPFSTQGRANSEFQISEAITSGFAMGTLDIGTLRLVGGARVEGTENSARANEIRVERIAGVDRVTATTPRNATGSYRTALPSVNARYQLTNDLTLRASWTNGMSRPAPGDLIPSQQVNAQLNPPTVVIGNPELTPATSVNWDISADYALPLLGLLSVAGFTKSIDKFVFSQRTRLTSGAFAGYDELRRVNGDGGTVSGLELAWVQRFVALPGILKGFGTESNLTLVTSSATYPGRTESLPLTGPATRVLNLIGFYNLSGLDLRYSYLRRTERLSSIGAALSSDRYFAADKAVDATAAYDTRRFGAVFLNVRNASNEPTVEWVGTPDHPTSTTYYGRQINFGLRW